MAAVRTFGRVLYCQTVMHFVNIMFLKGDISAAIIMEGRIIIQQNI